MHRAIVCCLFGIGMASVVSAAPYRCTSNGQVYYSDRPCSGQTQLQAYGPVRTYPQMTPYRPELPKAPEHLQYLSTACASINEAIRTGPSRGVRRDVIQGLYEEYRQKCSVEDREARSRVRQDQMRAEEAQQAQRSQSRLAQQQAQVRSDRCDGMRDVIALKRKREAELNAKEIEALRSLERTYNDVCISR